MKKNILNSIKITSGLILLPIIIFVWLLGLIFTSIVSIITYCELKLTKIMKKLLGEEDF